MHHGHKRSNITTTLLLFFFLFAFTVCGFSCGYAIGINQGNKIYKGTETKTTNIIGEKEEKQCHQNKSTHFSSAG